MLLDLDLDQTKQTGPITMPMVFHRMQLHLKVMVLLSSTPIARVEGDLLYGVLEEADIPEALPSYTHRAGMGLEHRTAVSLSRVGVVDSLIVVVVGLMGGGVDLTGDGDEVARRRRITLLVRIETMG